VKKKIRQTKWLSGGAEQRETKPQWQTFKVEKIPKADNPN